MESETAFCPVYDAIDLLQEKWVLHVIRSLLETPRGFNELQRSVGGANTTTLARRLDELERLGIVSKTIESTMPPRTRYELTTAGRALSQVIDAIDGWARDHYPRCKAHAEERDGEPREAIPAP